MFFRKNSLLTNTVTLNDINTILPEIKIKDVKQKDIFDFRLIVNDGSKDSDPKYTGITAINDTLKINNGKLDNFEFKGYAKNYDPKITIKDYTIKDGTGYNLYISDNTLNYGKMDFTITQNNQKYDIVNSDILTGEYDNGYGKNVIAVNGSLKSFNFESGQINDYSINGTDSFDLVNGTMFNLHSIDNDVFSGLVNATAINGTKAIYDLSFVGIESGNFTNGFFNFTGIDGIFNTIN